MVLSTWSLSSHKGIVYTITFPVAELALAIVMFTIEIYSTVICIHLLSGHLQNQYKYKWNLRGKKNILIIVELDRPSGKGAFIQTPVSHSPTICAITSPFSRTTHPYN